MNIGILIGVSCGFILFIIFMNLYWKKKIDEKTRLVKETEAQVIHMEKMASLGTLAAGIAHEINNPLSFLVSNLECFKDYFNSVDRLVTSEENSAFTLEDLKSMIRESLEGALRIKRIVSDLRLFSRKGEPQKVLIDINKILESVLAIVWNEIKYKVSVDKSYEAKSQIFAEATQLSQVFLNILINASQAIHEKGTISLSTYEDEKNVYAKIKDSGCGISQDALTKIFDPFFSTKKSTGLGLSVSYNIIKKHGGDIKVESTTGKGTVFTVWLPKKKEGENEESL